RRQRTLAFEQYRLSAPATFKGIQPTRLYSPRGGDTMRLALALVLAIIATLHNAGVSAQKATPEVRTITGEWTFSAEGYVMPLSLRQDGTKVTGTLEGFHGPFPLQGEFKKGLIHFAGSSDGGGIRHSADSNDIDLFAIGTLQPDGSLA